MKTDENNSTASSNEKAKNDSIEKSKDEAVKKGIVTTSVISFAILLIVVIAFFLIYSRDHKKLVGLMDTQKVSMTDVINTRDSIISEWIMTFDDIEKNIALIKQKEKIIAVNSSSTEISKDKKMLVLEDIKYINTLLEQNKKKIASLTAQLQKSGNTMKVMQIKITELEATMKENETEIAELKTSLVDREFAIEQLNEEMTVVLDTLASKNVKISTQTYEMNKAFYVSGTFKELKAKGLLTKEGGFIGLGKTESLTGNFPDEAFIQIDITISKSLAVNSKNAKLISEHPESSYEFLRDADKNIISLEIKDPALFWKVSKYAVVETSK